MAEKTISFNHVRKLRHRGRASQISIYFGKLIRMFIFQNDWKVLPMSAVVAGMVAIVIRSDCFLTREGTLKGALALSCVALWNGCFNSIQVICRERSIVKREHRSGMHISSYTIAHALYQAMLCVLQTIVTVVVCTLCGVQFPKAGLVLPFFRAEIGITILLVTFAADMMSLFISSVVHSTTAAMTVMPFVLIFQLVFSGGVFPVPERLETFSEFTVSKYGMRCIAAQGDYNGLPMVSGWNTIYKMRDSNLDGSFTVEQLMSILDSDENSGMAEKIRETEIVGGSMTVGEIIDLVRSSPDYEEIRSKEIKVNFKISDLLEMIGEDEARVMILEKTSNTALIEDYAGTAGNIALCWTRLVLYALAFFLFTMISLKFIDRDKR